MNKIERRGLPEGASTAGSTIRYPYPPWSSACLASVESAAQVIEGWVMAIWASRRQTKNSHGDGHSRRRALGVDDEKIEGACLPEALDSVGPPASLIVVCVPQFPHSLHLLRPSRPLVLDIAGACSDMAAIQYCVRRWQLGGCCASKGLPGSRGKR